MSTVSSGLRDQIMSSMAVRSIKTLGSQSISFGAIKKRITENTVGSHKIINHEHLLSLEMHILTYVCVCVSTEMSCKSFYFLLHAERRTLALL